MPQAHYLEAWGDVRTVDGTVSITQPLIEPIFGGKSTLEILAAFLGIDETGEQLVQQTAKSDYMKASFSNWNWKKALHDGIVASTAYTPVKPTRIPQGSFPARRHRPRAMSSPSTSVPPTTVASPTTAG